MNLPLKERTDKAYYVCYRVNLILTQNVDSTTVKKRGGIQRINQTQRAKPEGLCFLTPCLFLRAERTLCRHHLEHILILGYPQCFTILIRSTHL